MCVRACVRVCVFVCVCVDGCFQPALPKTRGPESDDSPSLLDAATRRADVICPETKSYYSQ